MNWRGIIKYILSFTMVYLIFWAFQGRVLWSHLRLFSKAGWAICMDVDENQSWRSKCPAELRAKNHIDDLFR